MATYARRSGIQRLLDCLPKRGLLLVLNYHRIGDAAHSPYDPGVFSATEEELDQQIRFLKRQTRIADLADVIDLAEGRVVPREPWTLITFDDGYRDNYRCAFPILRSHSVQGVFFLCTSFVGTRTLPWWDSIAYLVRNCGKSRLVLRYPYHAEFDCQGTGLRSTLRQILGIYKTPGVNSGLMLSALQESCGITAPRDDSERCFINWEEAAEMAAGGMALGAHSHQHEVLSKLSAEAQFQDVWECKRSIEEHAGTPVEAFAYPVGAQTSFGRDTVSALTRAGFRVAFSFYGGVNLPSEFDAFNIRRCGVEGQIPARFECQVRVTKVAARFWP